MSSLVRYSMILSVFALILGSLALIQPKWLGEFGQFFWEAPRYAQSYRHEKNRSHHLGEYQKALEERRAEIRKIVEAISNEKIAICEAALRVQALHKDRHLPDLRWPDLPKEKWQEQLHLCLIEQVAFEVGNETEKGRHLLERLKKEILARFPLARVEFPFPKAQSKDRVVNNPVGVPLKKEARLKID